MGKWEKLISRYLQVAMALVIVFLLFRNCEKSKDYERVVRALEVSQGQVTEFEEIVGENGDYIASQEQLLLTKDEAIEAGLLQIERLKNVKSKVRVVTETRVDTIFAGFEDDKDSTLPLGSKAFDVSDEWYSMNGLVTWEGPTSGIAIRELRIKNEYTITIADKKLGYFKAPLPSVILENKNPYTSTQEMQNVVIVKKEPFYRKPWFWTSVGVGVGLYLNRN